VKYSVILILLAAFSLPIYPQAEPPVVSESGTQTTRSIEGTVLDAKGSPVSGAIILLKDTKTLQVRSYIAQKDGKYHFFGLSSDINYELRAQANGMTSPEKMVSVFDSRRVVKLNLKLKKKLKSSS
jgi:Carboxypeptidase regulatory-like domain